jgi:uncharacterized lipoprotein YbaY
MQKLFLTALIIAAAGCAKEKPAATETSPPPSAAAPAEITEPDEEAAPALQGLSASGEVTWPEDAALPADARLRVSLIDASKADASAETLAEATYPVAGGPPVTFTLTTDRTVDPSARLAVRAVVSDGVALLFTSDTYTPVSPVEGDDDLVLTLVAVDPALGTAAGTTPVPIAYDCGGDTVEIAIEAGAAYVTIEGEDAVTLKKLSGGDDAPQSFTDGRLTVFFDGSDMDGLKLRLAPGKAAPLDCTRAE